MSRSPYDGFTPATDATPRLTHGEILERMRTALAAADEMAQAAVNENDDNPCRFCNGAWFSWREAGPR